MDDRSLLDALLETAEELGLEIRREPIDGESGGLCRIRGRRILFVDTLADLGTRVQHTCEALAALPEIDDCYLRPDIRERIERARAEKPQ